MMGAGLIPLWVALGRSLMWAFRNPIRGIVLGMQGDWQLKLVLFASLLALLEEAVTVTMTNPVPLVGVPVGAAYITASVNYLDVVALHSMVVFIPMFIAWAVHLSRWDFTPAQVVLLFGLTGAWRRPALEARVSSPRSSCGPLSTV